MSKGSQRYVLSALAAAGLLTPMLISNVAMAAEVESASNSVWKTDANNQVVGLATQAAPTPGFVPYSTIETTERGETREEGSSNLSSLQGLADFVNSCFDSSSELSSGSGSAGSSNDEAELPNAAPVQYEELSTIETTERGMTRAQGGCDVGLAALLAAGGSALLSSAGSAALQAPPATPAPTPAPAKPEQPAPPKEQPAAHQQPAAPAKDVQPAPKKEAPAAENGTPTQSQPTPKQQPAPANQTQQPSPTTTAQAPTGRGIPANTGIAVEPLALGALAATAIAGGFAARRRKS